MSTIESEKNDMTKKTGSIILFFLLITALLLPKQAVYAGTISISSTKETIYEGESIQLDIDGSETDVTWSSANDKIAIVDSDGIVTG
ncbi:MAG: Ig-like domain-containing protein, partial [Lachnospiraceae bacterium]|nr:Ig-like domain-containing protein [Lachnospiraceae bacterium]